MARKIANKVVDLDAGTVTFEFANGEKLIADAKDLDKPMTKRATLHGLAQKVGDSYSGADSAEEALKAAADAWTSIKEGNWSVGRTGSGESKPSITKLAKGLARATGKSLEEATAVLEAMEDEQKKELRAHPEVKAAMAAITAEEAAAKAKKGEGTSLSDMFK